MSRDDVIREVMSMVGCKYQVAKSMVLLAALPDGVFRKIGPSHLKRSMSSAEAKRTVERAKMRIQAVDEGG